MYVYYIIIAFFDNKMKTNGYISIDLTFEIVGTH